VIKCLTMTGDVETVSESHGATTAADSDVEAGSGHFNYEKRSAGSYYYIYLFV